MSWYVQNFATFVTLCFLLKIMKCLKESIKTHFCIEDSTVTKTTV